MAAHAIRRVVSYFAPPGRKTGPGFLNLHYWSIYFIKTKLYMHTKIWWSYVHIRYLVHVQKWTYLALGRPYGWALNFKNDSEWHSLSANQTGDDRPLKIASASTRVFAISVCDVVLLSCLPLSSAPSTGNALKIARGVRTICMIRDQSSSVQVGHVTSCKPIRSMSFNCLSVGLCFHIRPPARRVTTSIE